METKFDYLLNNKLIKKMFCNDFDNVNDPDYILKFVIIGDSNVGKSCIMHHFFYNKCNRK
jgi:GTPase SAR1 family protein